MSQATMKNLLDYEIRGNSRKSMFLQHPHFFPSVLQFLQFWSIRHVRFSSLLSLFIVSNQYVKGHSVLPSNLKAWNKFLRMKKIGRIKSSLGETDLSLTSPDPARWVSREIKMWETKAEMAQNMKLQVAAYEPESFIFQFISASLPLGSHRTAITFHWPALHFETEENSSLKTVWQSVYAAWLYNHMLYNQTHSEDLTQLYMFTTQTLHREKHWSHISSIHTTPVIQCMESQVLGSHNFTDGFWQYQFQLEQKTHLQVWQE